MKYKITATNGEMQRTEDIFEDNELFKNCKTE